MWHKVDVDFALSYAGGRSDGLILPVGRHRVRCLQLGVLLNIVAPPRVCRAHVRADPTDVGCENDFEEGKRNFLEDRPVRQPEFAGQRGVLRTCALQTQQREKEGSSRLLHRFPSLPS